MKHIISLIFLLLSLQGYSATCIATTGNYSNIATWSCGHIPANGDIVIYNYLGQEVIIDKVNGKKMFNIDKTGLYFLKVKTGDIICSIGINVTN